MKTKCYSLFHKLIINYHLFSFLSLLIFLYALYDVMKGYLVENTKTIKPDNSETCRNSTHPFCNTSDDVQFSSFILLALDGVSYHYIQPILDLFGKNAQLYRTITDLNKFTQAIFRTWLTGRENTKFQPLKIEEDNIMLSFNRTYGIKLYIGGNLNLFKAGTVKPYNTLFAYMDPYFNRMDVNTFRAFVRWLDKKEKINDILQLCQDNNYSLMLYDDGTDHVQHYEGATTMCSNFSLSKKIPERLCEDILPVKEFIDNNNNYVLIICSDHGHDEAFYDDNIKNVKLPYLESFTPESHWRYYDHGGYIINNTGWWMFYSPLLSPSYRTINITDVASTWMKYIKNVDIPANNIGRPMNSMLYIRNEIKVKQQGLAQMWNLCRKSAKYCKGNVYEEGLEWKEGSISEIEEKRLKGIGELQQKEIKLVKNLVSMNATEVFPYNLSVNELIRISEGRDKQPRRKEKMNITTHYYYEYDMDENGDLLGNSSEKNEKLNISKEKAKEIIDKYNSFINESEILHDLLYDTLAVIKHSDYYNMGYNTKNISKLILYFSYFINIILFYIILKNHTRYYLCKNIIGISKSRRQRRITIIFDILLLFFLILYGRIFYFSFYRMKTMMEYLSQPEIHVATFRSYELFHSLYGIVANYLYIYSSILLIIVTIKLIVDYKKYKGNSDNTIKNANNTFLKSFILSIKNRVFFSSTPTPLYSLYIHPILKIIMTVIIIPHISTFLNNVNQFRRKSKKFKKYSTYPSLLPMKINLIAFFISLLDLIIGILNIIIIMLRERKKRREEKERIREKVNKGKKENNLYVDLFDRILLVLICYNFVKFTDIHKKRKYYKRMDINMLLISFFTIITIISETIKKRKRINIIMQRPPSLFNFFIEFNNSYSIINSFRACIANSSYFNIYMIFFSLFFSDNPLHLPLFLSLSFLLLYVLLPFIYSIIRRISYYIICNENVRNNINDNIEKEEITIDKNNNKNNNKNILNVVKHLLLLFLDWIEILILFITLHLTVEYISFSYYAWLYVIGESASFEFLVNRSWIGLEDMEYDYVLTSMYMIIVKAGIPSVLFFCSTYMRDIKGYMENNRINNVNENEKGSRNEGENELNELNEQEDNSFNINNINNNKHKEIYNIFHTHIALLFVPLPLSFLLQVVSLFLFSHIGNTSDIMKQLEYLIYCLVQAVSSVFSIIPLLF